MMLYVVIFYLWVSLLIYLLMGGADYGAGILELFTPARHKASIRETSYHAMGPIWEANHMWLIIAVVILFVGFPQVYTTVSVYLHIPLVIMLMGIIARGTSFTFRNYDAVKDDWEGVYSKIFVYSSFITPLFLGIIAGSAVSGNIDSQATTFAGAYVYSWFNLFSFAVGFFTVFLCGFLAAVYLIGEVKEEHVRKNYIRAARFMSIAIIVFVGIIFMAATLESIPLAYWIFGNSVSFTASGLSILSAGFLWIMIYKNNVRTMRFTAGFMITMLLIAVTYVHYPNIVLLKDGEHLSLLDEKGEDKTIDALGSALLIGSLFILPALFYLLYSFSRKEKGISRH